MTSTTNLHVISVWTPPERVFTCPRTCPIYEPLEGRPDRCLFMPALNEIVTVTISSHTATIKVDYRNREALAKAIERMGGRVIGLGEHKLFAGMEPGWAWQFNNWRYPCILRADGSIAFDDYGGRWGNRADLEMLERRYAAEAAVAAAEELGWATERDGDIVTVFYPTGGSMTIDGAALAAEGFVGAGCHDAARELLERMGASAINVTNTSAASLTNQQHHVEEGGV